ncbi:hypothetical protein [Pedobacter sp.]
MKKTLHSAIFYTILFLGLISPMLVFSQQDTPKRVSVVVTAKEISPDKQLVQVPADNLPKTISKPIFRRSTKPTEKTISDTYVAVAKAPVETIKAEKKSVKTTVKPKPEKPAVATEETKAIAPAPTDNSANQQFGAGSTQNTASKTTDSISPADDISISKTVQQIGEKTITTIKARKDNKELATFTHSSKVNSISYIWIGCFLIIAGVVLGLLFGRPAFLISFVGVVFITLGLVI